MTDSAENESGLYQAIRERVEELREKGVEPDRIVVPADDWRQVKEQAEVRKGEGTAGGDLTLVNGVQTLFNERRLSSRIIIEVDR